MRIVAGRFRGRALAELGKGDPAAHLRPTGDRVRESLFNILATSMGDPVSGARVLDLFAGTGALGLEALSRGAEAVTFVENGRKSLALLRDNVGRLGVTHEVQILGRDVRRIGQTAGPGHELVFLDPPYGKGLGERALGAALAGGWIAPGALVVWEESAGVSAPQGLALLDERRYGDTVIRLFEVDAPSD